MDRPANRSAQPQQPENLLVRVAVLVLKFIPTLTKGPQCGLLGAGAVKLCGWRVTRGAMADRKSAKPFEAKAVWADALAVDPVFVDELYLQMVNDRYYLTFGQLRLPLVDPSDSSEPIVAQLQPVVRLIVAKGTLKRFAAALSGAIGPASGKNT